MEFSNRCEANMSNSTISKPAADTQSTFSALETPSSTSADQLTGSVLPSAVFRSFASVITFLIISDFLPATVSVSSAGTDSFT
ncbi:hypothetical protein Hanom_Chr03g00224341 [Helianthus anomalus]